CNMGSSSVTPLSDNVYSRICSIFIVLSLIQLNRINFRKFICKDSDNYGNIAIFAPRISIVYQVTQRLLGRHDAQRLSGGYESTISRN
ncbi:MAG: hypothetical protein J6Q22_13495, partial [Prevotella sp.]|nr:hypothetical protein [Prevotella sp.]